MPKRIGRYTLVMDKPVSIQGSAAVVGKKEGEGPLGPYFDHIYQDTTLGEKSWEKAESRLQQEAVGRVLTKTSLSSGDIDFIVAGDLLNQCIGSTYGIQIYEIPFLGVYGACSTMAESLIVASLLTESGASRRCIAVTSSHFCSAERQFRFPLEYGGVRTPTAQWTATASGAVIVSPEGDGPYVKAVTVGRIEDLGIKDANNMGAAMAPAAASTIKAYLEDTGESPENFDLILTGDLGYVGTDLLIKLLLRENIDISKVHNDCGLMIFDREKQDVHAGGSGCGCSASVLCSYILPRMKEKTIRRILFIATGALLSTTSTQQGENIPSVAHLVEIAAE